MSPIERDKEGSIIVNSSDKIDDNNNIRRVEGKDGKYI